MRKNVNLLIEGDWNFYGTNELGDIITVIPKKIELTEYGYIAMLCELVDDASEVEIALSPIDYHQLFGNYPEVINHKFTISFDIILHDGEDPDTIINYISDND